MQVKAAATSPVVVAPARVARDRVILGIDPGLQRTGYAVLSGPHRLRLIEAGVVRLDVRQPLGLRLVELADSLAALIRTHRPFAMVCEELYAHYKHPRTAILMAHARGVILAEACRAELELVAVSATRVKKTLTGHGAAGKAQVQQAVRMTLGLPQMLEPHDVADAAAIALCGASLLQAGGRFQAPVVPAQRGSSPELGYIGSKLDSPGRCATT